MRSRHRRQVPVAIDDTDPAIKYSGAWSRVSPSEGQYADTVTGTVEVGASAQYTFTGAFILHPSALSPPFIWPVRNPYRGVRTAAPCRQDQHDVPARRRPAHQLREAGRGGPAATSGPVLPVR